MSSTEGIGKSPSLSSTSKSDSVHGPSDGENKEATPDKKPLEEDSVSSAELSDLPCKSVSPDKPELSQSSKDNSTPEEQEEVRHLLEDIFMGTAFGRLKAAGLVNESPSLESHRRPRQDEEMEAEAKERKTPDTDKSRYREELEIHFQDVLRHLWAALLAMDMETKWDDNSRQIGSDWDRQQQAAKRQALLKEIIKELETQQDEKHLADLMLTAIGLSMKRPALSGTETSMNGVLDQLSVLLNQITDNILQNTKFWQQVNDGEAGSAHHFRQSS